MNGAEHMTRKALMWATAVGAFAVITGGLTAPVMVQRGGPTFDWTDVVLLSLVLAGFGWAVWQPRAAAGTYGFVVWIFLSQCLRYSGSHPAPLLAVLCGAVLLLSAVIGYRLSIAKPVAPSSPPVEAVNHVGNTPN